MAFEVDDVEHARSPRPGVSGTVIHALVASVRARVGEAGIAQMLALAAEDRSFPTLTDPIRWTPLDEAAALFASGALVTNDPALALHVGEDLLWSRETSDLVDRVRALGSPAEAVRHVGALVARFEGAADAVALEVASGRALVEVTPTDGGARHPHLCELTRGMLTELPAVFGLDPATISEHECAARGGRTCRYEVQWADVPGTQSGGPVREITGVPAAGANGTGANGTGPGGRTPMVGPTTDWSAAVDGNSNGSGPDPARSEVEQLEQLIEATSGGSTDVLELDADTLLAELGARADRVVPADRYLLAVRLAPGQPIEFHHRGLDDEEAQARASDLWNSDDNGDDNRVAVDIASARQRYGRLAAFVDPAVAWSSTDDRTLRHVADYVAGVLDVFTILNDARRSNTTARTILSFSEQLSGVTDLTEVLQILADTVPAVTGSAQSTVYLWDHDSSRLVLGAYTTGMAPPDADLGPIVPEGPAPQPDTDVAADEPESAEPAGERPLSVDVDNPLIRSMIRGHGVMVLDVTTVEVPLLRSLMERSGIQISVIAPLFASGEFLGVIAANYQDGAPTSLVHDPDVHERLSGLADHAAIAVQNLELLDRVSHMAWHDVLTGLPNRRLFEDRVEQELVRSRRVGEPVCMFFVDLDNFKIVNDTFGHATGDVLIQQVGQRLVDTVRSQDTVARVGGDEFAILLPGLVDQLSINQLAQRTLEAMHTPFDIFGEEVRTSASVGIAIAPEHGDTYDDLLNRADEAMYRAKDQGRDAFEMFRHSPEPGHPGRRAIDDRELHADLVSALDGNEFFLVYQPYVDLRTAEIVGVEALVRWRHPVLGVLAPSQFISIAERSDLIVALDNWVLWQACRQLRAWQDHGIGDLRLSVNVASRDLASPDFFENVERTLRETAIDPSRLELEITERVVLDRNSPAMVTIDRLRTLGVRFTVDDFGSGNSSLDRIGNFPVSTLKIDESFVQVLGPEDGDSNLVAAIIAMASELGLSCVAEGVESLQQSRVLLQRGCTTAQGYYFSPPLPPEGVEAMVRSRTPAEVPDFFGEPPAGSPPPDQPRA